MPNLHDLFDAASEGLPPLPDLAPNARRIVRRRRLATRSAGAALSSALVIGAGTFIVSAQHMGGAANHAGNVPHTFSDQYVLDTLRALWPISGQHLALDPTYNKAIVISAGGQTVGRMTFEVNPDSSAFPAVLGCMYGDPSTCVTTRTSDGDQVHAEYAVLAPGLAGSKLTVTGPQNATAPATATAQEKAKTSTTTAQSHGSAQQGGTARAYRLHNKALGQLTLLVQHGTLPTDEQLLALVESPAYEELIESATAASSYEWLGTPPATATTGTATPTAPYSPPQSTPPTQNASVTPPRGSDSAQPPTTP
jgi:hypothetical protein